MNNKQLTTIYLCRHGEVHNPKNIVYGRLPGHGLSTQGKKEAEALAQYLMDNPVTAIYSSPLLRTVQTAQEVARTTHIQQIKTDDRLLEVQSQFDGKPQSFMDTFNWNFYLPKYIKENGESLADLWKRMSEIMYELVGKHTGEQIVLVSHGDPIMTVVTKLRGEELTVESIRKNYVTHAHGFRLEFIGKTCTSIEPLEF